MFKNLNQYGLKTDERSVSFVFGLKVLDWVILIVSLSIALLWFLSGDDSEENLRADVYVEGQMVYSQQLELLDEEEKITKDFNGVKVVFETNGVSVESSPCRNQLCVKTGLSKYDGDVIACIPQKVVITLTDENKNTADIVTY